MKDFRDLYIHLHGHSINDLIERLTKQCTAPWTRAIDKEENLSLSDHKMFCFVRDTFDNLPKAALVLSDKKEGVWYIPNIVPAESGEMSVDEYNGILLDFEKLILRPARAGTKIRIKVTTDSLSIRDRAGERVEKALESFSNLANKATGGTHPSDRERWFRFLVLANHKGRELDTELVGQTLLEHGWMPERVEKLRLEFEFAQGLLSYAKANR
jgi:hypothetical protein